MSWQDSKEAREGGEFFRLKADGERATIIIAGEPRVVKRAGTLGQVQTRFYVPIIQNGQIRTWDMAGRTLDVLAALPDHAYGERIVVTRHGAPNDANTTYALRLNPLSPEDKERLVRSGLLMTAGGGTPTQESEDTDDTIPF